MSEKVLVLRDSVVKITQMLSGEGIKVTQRGISARRDGATAIKAGASLEVSVSEYIKTSGFTNPAELSRLCSDILTEAKGVLA